MKVRFRNIAHTAVRFILELSHGRVLTLKHLRCVSQNINEIDFFMPLIAGNKHRSQGWVWPQFWISTFCNLNTIEEVVRGLYHYCFCSRDIISFCCERMLRRTDIRLVIIKTDRIVSDTCIHMNTIPIRGWVFVKFSSLLLVGKILHHFLMSTD